jgi:hypothetical protein
MDFRRSVRCVALFFVIGLLSAGCGHMPVTSMVKLARVVFTATDPARVRLWIAVRLASGKEDVQDFRLTDVSDPGAVASLRNEIQSGTHVFTYGLDPAEAARLVAFRDALKKQQATSGGRRGAITISIAPEACHSGELADGPLLFTTHLRTAETADYVSLARDVDMRSIAEGRDLATEMPLCGQMD